MQVDRQALLAAVSTLIGTDSPQRAVEALEAAYAAAGRAPVALTGEWAVLNPLVSLRRGNPAVWEQTKELVDTYRRRAGREPCWPETPYRPFAERRNEYQRDLMRRIRERTGRASAIENLQRPPAERLAGSRRLEFERNMQRRWGERRDHLLAQAARNAGRRLTRDEASALRDAFWLSVDRELDELEERARHESLKPAHQRRKIHPNTVRFRVTSEPAACQT